MKIERVCKFEVGVVRENELVEMVGGFYGFDNNIGEWVGVEIFGLDMIV